MARQTSDTDVELIEPEDYPQMVSKRDSLRCMQTLQSDRVVLKAKTAMASYTPMLRDAILEYVEALEGAGTDLTQIFAIAHEIRNFAANAGMGTAGRVAENLCRYMDEMERVQKPVDPAIVTLHVAAIARAARAEEDDAKMGDVVSGELNALVKRRLNDAGVR
ncbi:MAG TPA: hypothetical protein VFA87_05665 [Rhizomicrobium sp.]|nr:hypothetical protein [Rhizomicrobium sp.]